MTDRIYAAVMAAGESTRFGATKQLVDIDGESMVRRACRIAADLCRSRTLLVAGHDWRHVQASSGHPYFIINDNYRSGLGSSIASATRALQHTATSLLVTLADQVRIGSDDLRRLIALHRENPDSITISQYAETLGPPVIFPPRTFGDLAMLDGADGARSVIRSGRYPLVTLACDNGGLDIDRPDDLNALGLSRGSDEQI